MGIVTCFVETYQDARARFLNACAAAGISVTSYPNPSIGMSGERLFTDVARIGASDAPRVLIVESGTHEELLRAGRRYAQLWSHWSGSHEGA